MGGDEFVVLVDATSAGDRTTPARRGADRRSSRPAPGPLDGHEIVVSASIGVVHAPTAATGAAELMQAADTTLYWAKADGRDRYALFDADRHRSDVDRFALSARMPDALARGEFVVEYQPLVRLADRRTIGVEALVRWKLPAAGGSARAGSSRWPRRAG